MDKFRNKIIPMDLGKIPPQCCDLEEAVLGALMLEKDAIDKISLNLESFYRESHQKIFKAILDLSQRNEPVDLLTVSEELKKLNWLEEIGGSYYLTELACKVANASSIVRHSQIIEGKFLQRQLIKFSSEIMERSYDSAIDPDDVIDYANSELDKLSNGMIGDDEPVSISQSIRQSVENIKERFKAYQEGRSLGIRTPLHALTRLLTGWLNKKLYVIAARPSMGKTAVALKILETAAIEGESAVLFSLEMDNVDITDRILLGNSGVNSEDFKFGNLSIEGWKQIDSSVSRLQNLNILIDDKPKSIFKIRSRAKSLKRKGKCSFIVIDYLQLIESDDSNKANREQEVAKISKTAKSMAMELELPVILLAQLNREVEKRPSKRPQLSDLRESGAIEQDADCVMFIFRPEYYGILEDENGNSTKGLADLTIAKHRGGRLDSIPFRFNDSFTNMFDIDYISGLKPSEQSYNPNQSFEPNKKFDEDVF
jgi:replicative DNA helicase